MLRKGYIERQTEMLAMALAKILGLKQGKDTEAALVELRVASKRLVGLDLETTLTALPEQTLISLFTAANNDFDAGRCLAAAALLAERAELGGSGPLFEKALALMLEAVLREERLRKEEWRARIASIRAALEGRPLPASLRQRLAQYDAIPSAPQTPRH